MFFNSAGFVVSGVSFSLGFLMVRRALSVFLRVCFGSSVGFYVAGEMGFYLDFDLRFFWADSPRFYWLCFRSRYGLVVDCYFWKIVREMMSLRELM